MQELLKKVYNSKRISLMFKIISHIVVAISCAAYLLLLYLFYRDGGVLAALRFAAAGGIPFVIVTLLRALIDAPRPYELYGFYEVKPKGKAGRSFPSRHVFSAFLIATLSLSVSLPMAVILFLLGAALAAARVVLGIHFIRDVVAGALIGALAGVLGIFII